MIVPDRSKTMVLGPPGVGASQSLRSTPSKADFSASRSEQPVLGLVPAVLALSSSARMVTWIVLAAEPPASSHRVARASPA